MVALLLLIPLTRFGPTYLTALTDPAGAIPQWTATAAPPPPLSRRRQAGRHALRLGIPAGDLRLPALPAATLFLDSQPLTGVPADRHLTQSTPVETGKPGSAAPNWRRPGPRLGARRPGPLQPAPRPDPFLPDLRDWLAHYHPIGRTTETVIYRHE